MADKSMSTSSPFIRGIFFFLFLAERNFKRIYIYVFFKSAGLGRFLNATPITCY